MRDLHVVALSEDGRHLVLATRDPASSGDFRVAVDERLAAALRGELSRPGREAPTGVSPRDIQARLRDGQSVEEIAAAAGVPVGRIERYAGPVLAERERMVRGAQQARLVRPRLGPSGLPLGEAVALHLAEIASFRPGSAVWSARRETSGRWLVELSWSARARRRSASWRFDASTGDVQPLDAFAGALGHVEVGVAATPAATASSTPRAAPGRRAGAAALAARSASAAPSADEEAAAGRRAAQGRRGDAAARPAAARKSARPAAEPSRRARPAAAPAARATPARPAAGAGSGTARGAASPAAGPAVRRSGRDGAGSGTPARAGSRDARAPARSGTAAAGRTAPATRTAPAGKAAPAAEKAPTAGAAPAATAAPAAKAAAAARTAPAATSGAARTAAAPPRPAPARSAPDRAAPARPAPARGTPSRPAPAAAAPAPAASARPAPVRTPRRATPTMPPRTPAARATPGRRATDRPAAGNELRPAASHDVGAGRAAGAAGRRPDAVGHSGPPVLRVVPPAVDRDEPDDTVPAVPSSPEPDRHADAAPDPGGEPSRRPADGRREVEHQVGDEGVGHGVPAGEEAARDATGLEESPVAAAPPRRRAGGQDWADVLFGAPSASPPGRRPPS